jgi:hypothetical protein
MRKPPPHSRLKNRYSLGERCTAVVASLFFTVPTAVFVWLIINLWFGVIGSWYFSDTVLGYEWILIAVGIFSCFAFAYPRLYPDVLGALWHGIARFFRWWFP